MKSWLQSISILVTLTILFVGLSGRANILHESTKSVIQTTWVYSIEELSNSQVANFLSEIKSKPDSHYHLPDFQFKTLLYFQDLGFNTTLTFRKKLDFEELHFKYIRHLHKNRHTQEPTA